MRELFSKYRHFSVAGLFIVLQMLFNYLEKMVVPQYYMESWIDGYIPFVKVFIIPYVVWFLYIVAVPFYLGLKSKKEFYDLCLFMIAGQAACLLIYYLFPNGQNLRPVIVETDVFSQMIQWIYRHDTSTNVAPSIHVLYAFAIHMALMHHMPFRRIRILSYLSFLVMVSVILSTVFVKQHAAMDILYGLLLGGMLYTLIYRLLPWWKTYAVSKHSSMEQTAVTEE